MKISIAMATYNGAKYLREQLDSFITQTRKPDELVICDDKSTDFTLKIINDFIKTAPFDVRVYTNEHRLGYSKNFDRAITYCLGDIIFISDQDDVWFPRKIERIEKIFDLLNSVLVVIHDAELVDGKLKSCGITRLEQGFISKFPHSLIITTGCFTAFRKELCSLLLPIPVEQFSYDAWIHKVGDVFGRRLIVKESLQLYRRHGENVSKLPLNQTKIATSSDIKRLYLQKSSKQSCMGRLDSLSLLATRIIEKKNLVDKALGDLECEKAINKINKEINAMKNRINILNKNRVFRIFPAFKSYIKGEYGYSSGYRSLVRDLIY